MQPATVSIAVNALSIDILCFWFICKAFRYRYFSSLHSSKRDWPYPEACDLFGRPSRASHLQSRRLIHAPSDDIQYPATLCLYHRSPPARTTRPQQQAILDMTEDGSLEAIADPFFDSSRCAFLKSYESSTVDTHNLNLVDLGGVFLILGLFMGASFVIWIVRGSPPARWAWGRFFRWWRPAGPVRSEKVRPTCT